MKQTVATFTNGIARTEISIEANATVGRQRLEVTVGLEPTKIGFASRRLDHFGIATSGKQHGRIDKGFCRVW